MYMYRIHVHTHVTYMYIRPQNGISMVLWCTLAHVQCMYVPCLSGLSRVLRRAAHLSSPRDSETTCKGSTPHVTPLPCMSRHIYWLARNLWAKTL